MNLTPAEVALQKKFGEIADGVRAKYDTPNLVKTDSKTTLEQFKIKNEERRAERSARFEKRLALEKFAQDGRNAQLKERLQRTFECPPSTITQDVFKVNLFERAPKFTQQAYSKKTVEKKRTTRRGEYKEPEIQRIFGNKTDTKKEYLSDDDKAAEAPENQFSLV